jgi:hypothetical protein
MTGLTVQEITLLNAPFSVNEVTWKPQAMNKDKTSALGAAYASKWLYVHRLNNVFGGDWNVRYEMNEAGTVCVCHLSIKGITRSDVGEEVATNQNTSTNAAAQAFKRACAQFGLGLYFYDLPTVWGSYSKDPYPGGFTAEAKSKLKKNLMTPEAAFWTYIFEGKYDLSRAADLAIEAKSKGGSTENWKEALTTIRG